ncbi:hypothetical protein SAMN05192583_0744 [Sphingomonas gellani]|uniref:DUF2497 domain-containing protein n=1 Tax=Sphingomonas gellani TaxID=1166340 RepID=A0A1H7ZM06_9SPHN|nr:DUF2497 domain-containing protein [Sphingomonas gellani]SEM58974.1 hypothetical protein SAMN05192583_0744 [Sphingomonas gellani]
MGEMSAEPSMEEILSSIKRIIAEEGDPPGRPRRAARPVQASSAPQDTVQEARVEPSVLELDTPVSAALRPAEPPRLVEPTRPLDAPRPADPPRPAEAAVADPSPAEAGETILSRQAAEATRGSLDVLSKLVTKPEPGTDGTLEGLVREMLRPVLREWLDTHLPGMVETMVAREIAKITGQA